MAIPRTASIDIPIGEGRELLEVSRRDLGENEDFIFSVLNDENVDLWVYADIALEYWNQGMERQFEDAVRSGLGRAAKAPNPAEKRHHVLLLNLLISRLIEKARAANEDSKSLEPSMTSEEYLNEATRLLNDVTKLDALDMFAIVARGNIRMARKEYAEALLAFEGALSRDQKSVPALIGEAAARFALGQHRRALDGYQKVLRLKPNLTPDVRVAIGICYHQLGAVTQARKAFTRAVELDPSNLDAAMLLAIMDWNRCRHAEQDTDVIADMSNKATAILAKVHAINSRHPLFAAQMAQRKLLQSDYSAAIGFAEGALGFNRPPRLCAEALCCKGKALQAQGDYQGAYIAFLQSVKLNPDSLAAQYCLAMVNIQKGDLEAAYDGLKFILTKEPHNLDVLLMLASLYTPSASHQEKAVDLFNVALKVDEKKEFVSQPHVLLDMARSLERTDTKEALSLHVKALKALHEQQQPIPLELHNNIAAICFMLAERETHTKHKTVEEVAKQCQDSPAQVNDSNFIDESHRLGDTLFQIPLLESFLADDALWCSQNLLYVANEILSCAIARSNENQYAGGKSIEQTKVTLLYNLGRVREALEHTNKATAIYTQLAQSHPAYFDSRLRLGIMLLQRREVQEAVEIFKLIIDTEPKNVEARLNLGRAYMMIDSKVEAKRAFDAILKSIDPHNTPALVGLANVQLSLARSARHKEKERESWILGTHRLYETALNYDKRNVPAAIGLGIVLAESGFVADAKVVFNQVEQATGNNPSVVLNLAHTVLSLNEKDAIVAIPLYEKAIKKGYSNDPYAWAALARAYYILGRVRKDDVSMNQSLRCVQKAIRLNPSDAAMIFNLAVVKLQVAGVLNDQSIEKRVVKTMEAAKDGIATAERLLTALAARTPESRPNYTVEHAVQRRDYCKEVRKLCEKKIHETTTLERQREERKEMILQQQKDREDAKRRKEEEERALQEEREAKIAKQREEDQKRVQANEASYRQHEEQMEKADEERKKGRGRGAKRSREALSDAEGDESQPNESKRKLMRKKSGSALAKKPANGEGKLRERGVKSQLSAEYVEDSDQDDNKSHSKNGHANADGEDANDYGNEQSRGGDRGSGSGEDDDDDEDNVRVPSGKIQRPSFDDSDDEERDPTEV
ncbi:hypothetical protein BDZ88DRAFT_144375 [Geranomyces variabilis]|nr:hypothetical protein BDZ88DRAFT_144375 [Geranomyces variabilis]KAJ3143385.1 protein required for normal CLN1 and CLN2 G1 cyclin expression [Geranomyces variabilis]